MKKKYHSYKLRIITNEETKYVKLNNNVNQTSYATMVKYYHMTKDKYKNQDCTIELVGVNKDETIGSTIFSKEFKTDVETDKELLLPTDKIIGEIKHLLELLTRKEEYHSNMLSALNKKQDLLLHKVESISSFEGTKEAKKEEKLKIINSLEQTRHERRFNKNEFKKIKIVNKFIDIESLKGRFEELKIPIDVDKYEYINGELEDNIVREISYNSIKQRDNIIKAIEKKYDKIADNVPRKILICYNYGYNKNNK